jgi:uncharacterized membrane protein YbhN (UPF0104 family)
LRFGGALILLAATLLFSTPGAVMDRLASLAPGWVVLGVALSVPTYLLLALRWWHVARRVGAPMSYSRSLADYYLGSFANQTLPTGLAGAALRAIRHASCEAEGGGTVGYGKAVSAVVLERISGLVALAGFALVGALILSRENPMLGLGGGIAVVAITLAAAVAFRLTNARATQGDSFLRHAQSALLRDGALWHHLLISSACVVLLALTFYCAAQATAVGISLERTFLVAPMILGSMVIPLSMAGWGVREAAAAALFAALGTDAATGVAVSITFGVISLIASLPGLVVWLLPKGSGQVGGVVEDTEEMIGEEL